jgi:hypothetical protein
MSVEQNLILGNVLNPDPVIIQRKFALGRQNQQA